MENHNCDIGLLHHNGYSELVTIDMLKDHIAENIETNKRWDAYGFKVDKPFIRIKVLTLRDYADFRKSTNLTRFYYCPECGKRIDWKTIGREENGE